MSRQRQKAKQEIASALAVASGLTTTAATKNTTAISARSSNKVEAESKVVEAITESRREVTSTSLVALAPEKKETAAARLSLN